MGLLYGSASITRFSVAVPGEGPDFEAAAFHAIEPGSEVRERAGIVPFEPGAPYEVAKGRWAFRVRVDRVRPDPTAVQERLKDLLRGEMEQTGKPFVGGRARKKLRELAEAELALREAPRMKLIECVIDGPVLYVGSTAKGWLGTVLALLRQAGVAAEFKAPWLDAAPEADEWSDLIMAKEPGQSVLGCRFLKLLLDDPEVLVEPETGSVRLATATARVILTGAVLRDLLRYVEEGAEILSAKLLLAGVALRFDALSYRIQGLKLDPVRSEHWTLELDERLERIAAVWETLDRKYEALKPRLAEPAPARAAAEAAVPA